MNLKNAYDKTSKIFLAAFLVALPVSSFPYFPSAIMGGALVRPMSLYPLLFLVVFVTLPKLWTKPLPRTIIPFLVFILVAFGSTALSLTRGIDPNISASIPGRAISALATLAIGTMFYLTVSLIPDSTDDLHFILRWLYVGLTLALLWGTAQSVYVLNFNAAYFKFFNQLQSYISIRPLVTFAKRVAGMAYEPSWFAEQLAFLYMPWLFSSFVSDFTVFRWRWRRLTVEVLLLIWSMGMLFLTFSRTGIVILVLLVIAAFFLWPRVKTRTDRKKWALVGKRFVQASLILVIMGILTFIIGRQNNYFSRIWRYFSPDEETTGSYLYYIAFDQRFIYWETAFRVFDDHPLFGVGLGEFAFYYEDYLPDRKYRDSEIFFPLVPEEGRSQIVTVKNMPIRILTETGIVGAAVFVAFLGAVIGCVAYLWLSKEDEQQFWGRAGLLGLIAFVPVVFSVDSFALPNMWVVFGLITASAHLFD